MHLMIFKCNIIQDKRRHIQHGISDSQVLTVAKGELRMEELWMYIYIYCIYIQLNELIYIYTYIIELMSVQMLC